MIYYDIIYDVIGLRQRARRGDRRRLARGRGAQEVWLFITIIIIIIIYYHPYCY